MINDVSSLLKPESVAVIGASATRVSQGNMVITNLLEAKFPGRIIPIHPTAKSVNELQAVRLPSELPDDIDLAVLAIPASGVLEALQGLERKSVRGAIIFANGFTTAEEGAIRQFLRSSRIVGHGPNCMGLINVTDRISLYPTRPSEKMSAGSVALVAQSGSAAISVMNSANAGFSKVVTMGSEFRVTAADYVRWLAADKHTSVIGVVTEDIADPLAFAEATEIAHSAGKAVVVLKVGASEIGAAAAQAHTGALISNHDAYARFFIECDIATARDYDELIASLECLSHQQKTDDEGGIAIAGISGGQTALACDVAERRSVRLAKFADKTSQVIHQCLPGSNGKNPIDIGASVKQDRVQLPDAIKAILDDDSVNGLALIQDAQDSLNPRSLNSYAATLENYAQAGSDSAKPVILISPTSQNLDDTIYDQFAAKGMPAVRGLNAGFAAIANMNKCNPGHAGRWTDIRRNHRRRSTIDAIGSNWKFDKQSGVLSRESSARLLEQYQIPGVSSVIVADEKEALARADEIGFPMVAKVVSTDILHRSEAGGVLVGIEDRTALEKAIRLIAANATAYSERTTIQGFELQQDLTDYIEVMVGFTHAPPFGSLIVVGTGGTTVELESSRALRLAPFNVEDATTMIAETKIGKLLSGYRRLFPETDIEPLSSLVSRLSMMADDFRHSLVACDLNPVMVKKESGQVCTVDTLFVVDSNFATGKQTLGDAGK